MHVLRHSDKKNKHQCMFFAARMQWVEVYYRTAPYTLGWVTPVLAKHVSMLLSALDRLCNLGTEPFPFTLSLIGMQLATPPLT